MNKLLIASLGALVLGCEEPKFEGELNAYAPACDNKPYVTAGFDSFTIECGEYFFEHFENARDCGSKLEQQSQTCFEKWIEGNCDGALDYWSKTCPIYDEEGTLISNTNEYSKLPSEECNQQYQESLQLIGHEAAMQKWIEWNNQ